MHSAAYESPGPHRPPAGLPLTVATLRRAADSPYRMIRDRLLADDRRIAAEYPGSFADQIVRADLPAAPKEDRR